jgi:hypothetical protein
VPVPGKFFIFYVNFIFFILLVLNNFNNYYTITTILTITGRKATSLSAASRIADFLGAEMVKDKG